MNTYDEIDVIVKIKAEVNRAGSQKDLAAEWGISEQYLSDLINNKRGASDKILHKLCLRRVIIDDPYA